MIDFVFFLSGLNRRRLQDSMGYRAKFINTHRMEIDGTVPSKDMQFSNLFNFIFHAIVKIHRKLTVFSSKMTRTRTIKIGKI